MVLLLYPARAPRADDLADPDRRQIGVESDPAALRRVAGKHQVAHQHLAFAGRRRFGLDEIEVAVLDCALRTAREQPLAVFHSVILVTMEGRHSTGSSKAVQARRKPAESAR